MWIPVLQPSVRSFSESCQDSYAYARLTIPKGETRFAVPGTFSFKPSTFCSAMQVVRVTCIGGGGAGGGGGGGTAGGGGGGYCCSIVQVSPHTDYQVVVGAGGSIGQVYYITTGGTASSFAGLLKAEGGTGAGNNSVRTAGGSASGGNICNLEGGRGGSSSENGGDGPTGGGGGYGLTKGGMANKPLGGAGGNGNASSYEIPHPSVLGSGGSPVCNGQPFGGGGGGGFTQERPPVHSCAGGNGLVLIEWGYDE